MEDSVNMVKLCNAQDKIQARMIIDILKNNGIPALSKCIGSGEYMNIHQGFSVFGEDVYVEDINKEKAEEIIAGLFDDVEEDIEEDNDDDNEDEDIGHIPFYKNRAVVARIIIALLLMSGIFAYVLSLILK